MNKKRITLLLQLFIISIFTVNCVSVQNGKTAEISPDVGNSASTINNLALYRWNLIEINGSEVQNKEVFIQFNSENKDFNGNAGCNQMFGKFEVINNQIKFSDVGTTKKFCMTEDVMKLENDFIKALGETTRYERQERTLDLFAGNNVVLKFSGMDKTASGNEDSNAIELEDKKWILVSIAGKPLPKVEKTPFLVFNKKEASAGGDTGCNSFGGSYKTEGNKIIITEIISTMRACIEDERMSVEREFLEGLRKANRYEIKAETLSLYEGEKLLLTFNAESKN